MTIYLYMYIYIYRYTWTYWNQITFTTVKVRKFFIRDRHDLVDFVEIEFLFFEFIFRFWFL